MPKLKFSTVNENIYKENESREKRDVKPYNSDDAFIPLQSTSTNFNLNEGNGIKSVPNALSSHDDKNLAETVTPSSQKFDSESTTSVANFAETQSINNFKTNELPTKINLPLTELKAPNFDTNELISSTEKIDLNQLTTDASESVSTSKFDTIDFTISYMPDKNNSTVIDFSTEKLSTPEFDSKTSSDDTISQLPTPKTDQTELNQSISQHSYNENNKDKIQGTLALLNENHLVEQNQLHELNQHKKNLTKIIPLNLPNTYYNQSKVTEVTEPISNIDLINRLNAKLDQFFAEADSTNFHKNSSNQLASTENYQLTTDALEETTSSNHESFNQFSDKNKSTVSIGVQTNLSVEKTTEKLKHKLAIPLRYKNTTHLVTTTPEIHHSSQTTEIPTILPNVTDLTEPTSDIGLTNKSSHLDEEATTQFGTSISEQNLYGVTSQENLTNKTGIIETTTKFSTNVEANPTSVAFSSEEVNTISIITESPPKSTSPSFTQTLETKSTFETESAVDKSTTTSEENQTPNPLQENVEDKNNSSSSYLNGTNKNEQISNTSPNDLLGMNRRATTMNQQVLSNNNNQFQLQPMNGPLPMGNWNYPWQPQEVQNIENKKDKAKDSISPGLPIATNQPQQIPISNQNYPLTVCPSGVKILQQSNAYPYYYNTPSLYQNILPLSSPAYNPYMNPQYPYQGGGNLPQFYNNQPLQMGAYQPNNFYRDNSLSNGQYYICSSLSSNPYIQSAPEIRKRNEFILQKTNSIADVK